MLELLLTFATLQQSGNISFFLMLPTERPNRWDTTSQNTRQVLFHGLEIETTPIIGQSPTCHFNMLKATSLEFDSYLWQIPARRMALCHFSHLDKEKPYPASKIWIRHALEVQQCIDNKMENTYLLIAKDNSTYNSIDSLLATRSVSVTTHIQFYIAKVVLSIVYSYMVGELKVQSAT